MACQRLIVDAQCDEDLDAIIAAALTCPQTPLLVGSAGLCDALARHLAPVKRQQLLAVVGSMVRAGMNDAVTARLQGLRDAHERVRRLPLQHIININKHRRNRRLCSGQRNLALSDLTH